MRRVWFTDGHLLNVSSHDRKSKRAPGVTFIRVLIPSCGLHHHDLITSQRPHLQILSHCGFRFQQINFAGTQTFSHRTRTEKINAQMSPSFFPQISCWCTPWTKLNKRPQDKEASHVVQWFSNLIMHQNHQEDWLLKTDWWAYPRVSDSVGLYEA